MTISATKSMRTMPPPLLEYSAGDPSASGEGSLFFMELSPRCTRPHALRGAARRSIVQSGKGWNVLRGRTTDARRCDLRKAARALETGTGTGMAADGTEVGVRRLSALVTRLAGSIQITGQALQRDLGRECRPSRGACTLLTTESGRSVSCGNDPVRKPQQRQPGHDSEESCQSAQSTGERRAMDIAWSAHLHLAFSLFQLGHAICRPGVVAICHSALAEGQDHWRPGSLVARIIGGEGWIRTNVGEANGFTVRPL